jgi:hypothetical protein
MLPTPYSSGEVRLERSRSVQSSILSSILTQLYVSLRRHGYHTTACLTVNRNSDSMPLSRTEDSRIRPFHRLHDRATLGTPCSGGSAGFPLCLPRPSRACCFSSCQPAYLTAPCTDLDPRASAGRSKEYVAKNTRRHNDRHLDGGCRRCCNSPRTRPPPQTEQCSAEPRPYHSARLRS